MSSLLRQQIIRFIAGLLVCAAGWRALAGAEDTNSSVRLSIDLNSVQVKSFFGLGIQWDPYAYPPRPEAWRQTLQRLDFARPAFFRVMTGGRSYCLGFDSGQPRYVWTKDEQEIRRRLGPLLDILDYAQSNHIEVLLGEWSPPGRLGDENVNRPDDPRWARLAADFVAWLRNVRGYTVIRMFNLMNEPNGGWMWPGGQVDYAAWTGGIKNLRRELDARGLAAVAIVGPDNSWDWDWADRVSRDLPECVGDWEMHWYATDKNVYDGEIEKLLNAKRKVILQNDPHAAGKPMFLAESGLLDGKTNVDQQPRVRTFEYGVMMADYAAQVMQAGWMALCAWDLDDAMHTASGHPPVPGEKTLKVWGFWNTQGTAMGQPDDEQMRPWFYTWSLMSRLFPRDARILMVKQPDLSQLRIVAAQRKDDGTIAVMLVNNKDEVRSVKIAIPGAGHLTVAEYRYFENDRPVDAQGFAAPKTRTVDADLAGGISIVMPKRGVIFLEAHSRQN